MASICDTSDTEPLALPDGTNLMFGGFDGDGDVLKGSKGDDLFILGFGNCTIEAGGQDGTDAIFGPCRGSV